MWTFHHLMGLREGIAGALDRGDGAGRLSRGPARGPLGWAWALSPRLGRVGFPLGFWFLLKVVGLGGLDLTSNIEHTSYNVKGVTSPFYVNGIRVTSAEELVIGPAPVC